MVQESIYEILANSEKYIGNSKKVSSEEEEKMNNQWQ